VQLTALQFTVFPRRSRYTETVPRYKKVCSNGHRLTLNFKKFVNDSKMLSPLVVCTSTSRPVGSSVDEMETPFDLLCDVVSMRDS
jgi:hypothetical protein